MKKKTIVAIMICLMMCGIFAGCGQSDAADTTDQAKKEEKTVENELEKTAEFDTAAAEKSLKEMSDALSSFLWASMMKEAEYSP